MKTLLDIMRKGRMKRESLKYDSKYVPGDDAMWRMKDGSNVGEKKNRGIVGNPDELAKKVQHKGKGDVSAARNKPSEAKDKPKEESKLEAKKEPSQPKEAKSSPSADLEKETASKITEATQKDAVVSVADLRDSFPKEMQGEEFDKAIINLAEQGKIIVYQDADPSSFSDEHLKKLVKDGNNYFTTISAASGSQNAQTGTAEPKKEATSKMPSNPDDVAKTVGKPKASSIMDKMRSKPKDAAPKEQPKEEPRPEAKAQEAPAETKKQTIPQQQANEIVTEALQNGTASSWIRHAINSSVRGGKGVDPDELESDANLALMEVASSLTPEEAADPSIFRQKAKAAITNAIIDSFRRKNTVKAGVGKKKQMGEEFDAADKKTEAPNADKVDAEKVRAFVQSLDSPVLQQIAEGKMNKVPIRKIAEELEISPGTAQRLWEKIVEKAGGKEDKFYKQKEAEGKERYGHPVRDDVWEEILKQSKQYPFPGEFVRCVMAAMEKSQGQWDAINAGRKAYMSGNRERYESKYVSGDDAKWKMKDGSNVGDKKNQGIVGSPDDMASSVGKGGGSNEPASDDDNYAGFDELFANMTDPESSNSTDEANDDLDAMSDEEMEAAMSGENNENETGKSDYKSKSKAKLNFYGKSDIEKGVRESANALGVSTEAFPDLVGAPDDAILDAASMSPGNVRVNGKGDGYDFTRYFKTDENGDKYIHNASFEAEKKGQGAEIFSNQVENAVENGFSYIRCHAAGNQGSEFNGYYTWPRYGYDQDISEFDGAFQQKVKSAFPEANSVLDIMETKEGRDWWKANGKDMRNAKFDLKPGSRSMNILKSYMDAKKGGK